MANIMIVLSHLIIIMRIIAEVNSRHAISPPKNYIMASEDKRWASNQIKKAENKCEEYKQYACQYQTPDRKYSDKDPILNGEYVSEGMLPHMAYLYIRTENTILQVKMNSKSIAECTASLISEKFVLTAAHCISFIVPGMEVKIKLGSVYKSNDGTGQWYGVDYLYKHPYYNHEYSLHDIGLIKLSETVRFNFYVRPICLSTNYDTRQYSSATAAGWGCTEYGKTDCLKMVELPTRESTCDFIFQNKSQTYYDVAKLYTICAGGTLKDTCQGDSGGPLQVQINNACPNTYAQIGVTASGAGNCSLSSSFNIGIYTKVAPYVPWIASIVWPS
ncbi:coagulation factor IX-like [Planococcus citri]|uniref:coagulation factor IX-like n=1 Tax=Planococcus citri TaxID=170843 RepID=UPI0031F8D59D